MSEKETETVVLDEALLREIKQDGKPGDKGDEKAAGRVIRLDERLKKPGTPDDDEAGS
ncbi:MAG: hypothetical protein PVG91_05180 [Gammaproteobacteria bacterium]|jgi:hypothetical protein